MTAINTNSYSKFNNLQTAIDAIQKSDSASKWSIILGDDNLYWRVTNKEASKLMRQGFSLAY